jgi:TolB-like protein
MSTPQRLDGWKAIGRFIGRDARTAQRWAQERNLPIRHIAGGGRSVFAWANELQAWLRGDVVDRGGNPAPVAARSPGLLVLPFEYHGPSGSDRAFVGDAVSAEILNRLAVAPIAELRVLSRTTARSFAQSPKRADELAADLGIRYLVEGAVIEVGERWSIDVRVVDASTDSVVLSDRFGAQGKDVLRLHTTIAEAVSGHLALNLAGHMVEPFWNDEVDPAAFLAYVRGCEAYTAGVDGVDLRRAVDCATEAIAIDPRFTPAYALRGLALNFYAYYYSHGDPALAAETRAMARHAIGAGPLLATSNILDGLVATYHDHDWDRAEQRYRFVVDRLPSDAHSRRNLAFNLSLREKFGEATSAIGVARELDRSPRLAMMEGMLHQWRRDYDAAADCFNRVLAAMPGDAITNINLILLLGLMLRDERRVRERASAFETAFKPQWGHVFDACVAVASNDTKWLAESRRKLRQQARQGAVPWYVDAVIAGAAGDADEVIASVTNAIAIGHGESVAHTRVEPTFDCARGDPRFSALLQRLNLVP